MNKWSSKDERVRPVSVSFFWAELETKLIFLSGFAIFLDEICGARFLQVNIVVLGRRAHAVSLLAPQLLVGSIAFVDGPRSHSSVSRAAFLVLLTISVIEMSLFFDPLRGSFSAV